PREMGLYLAFWTQYWKLCKQKSGKHNTGVRQKSHFHNKEQFGDERRVLKEKNAIAYEEDKTVILEIDGEKAVAALELIRNIRELCGAIVACRLLEERKFEVTMANEEATRKLLDGFRIGEVRVHARELCSKEMVVSFLGMPAYITDEVILAKLIGWGVAAVSDVKRRMWPGTQIADGTRFVRVRFTDAVQSLPYSTKFDTANGPEYVRVIHNKQIRVCRGCLQPGHIFRECPDFMCHKCGAQGHFAREFWGVTGGIKCVLCFNTMNKCMCTVSREEVEDVAAAEGSEERMSALGPDGTEQVPLSPKGGPQRSTPGVSKGLKEPTPGVLRRVKPAVGEAGSSLPLKLTLCWTEGCRAAHDTDMMEINTIRKRTSADWQIRLSNKSRARKKLK
uniref:CCHC-type domain-containing protein n=1 Tax=Gouania willdenowi TaxID=441366 RepID=A0A8C5GE18_GOUWI